MSIEQNPLRAMSSLQLNRRLNGRRLLHPKSNSVITLAYQLAMGQFLDPDTRQSLMNPHEIKKLAVESGIKFNPVDIFSGFTELTRRYNVQTLLNIGAVSKEQLPEFYQNTTSWRIKLVEFMEAESAQDPRMDPRFLPYPLDLTEIRNIPRADYLLNIAASFLVYMRDIPNLLKPGQQYALPEMISDVQRLYDFGNWVLAADVASKSDLLVRWQRIQGDMNAFVPPFNALLAYYRSKPTQIDRRA